MKLILPKYLNGNSLEQTLNCNKNNQKAYQSIDMSNIEFIFPYGLNMLIHIFETSDTINEIILPSSKIMSYLIRMDFFKNLELTQDLSEQTRYEIKLHDRGKNSDNKTLLELTRIGELKDTINVIGKIQGKIQEILKLQLNYSDTEVNMFKKIFVELCQNITRHSNAHGYASVQYIPYYTTRKSETYYNPLKIGITDIGMGFAKTYSPQMADKEALIRAVIENKTSKSSGGLGLKHIKGYIKEFGGEIYIRTGTAAYYQSGKGGEYELMEDLAFFPGSHIDVTLPTKNI
ncbi:hypothetical protein [Lysinibacillus xylanilyticus]|uniref:hypothetical protein n=1 Tax=Lysinibacillus xylanilyticus TaxID=582475 RepID=UPI003CFF186E